MIKYVLYEAMMYDENGRTIIRTPELAKKYGLRMGSNKVVTVKLGRPQDEPVNTDKIAYIHLYPQIDEENYTKIKQEIINVKD